VPEKLHARAVPAVFLSKCMLPACYLPDMGPGLAKTIRKKAKVFAIPETSA
jgi:hypothetical protein